MEDCIREFLRLQQGQHADIPPMEVGLLPVETSQHGEDAYNALEILSKLMSPTYTIDAAMREQLFRLFDYYLRQLRR